MIRLRLLGAEIGISFWFLAQLAGFALVQDGILLWYVLLPVAVHELGHLLAMAATGVQVQGIYFCAGGIAIRRGAGQTLGYGREVLICLAGPAVNLLMALWLHLAAFHSMRTMFLVAANLAVGLFHLLPIGDLDGGQLLSLLTSRCLPGTVAHRITQAVQALSLAGLLAVGLWLLLRWHHPILLLACAYLAAKQRHTRA